MTPANKRHVCFFAAAFILGILLATRYGSLWIGICVLLCLSFLWFLKQCGSKKEAAAVGCILAALIFFGFFLCQWQEKSYEAVTSHISSGTSIQLQGTVCRKERKTKSVVYELKNTSCQTEGEVFCGGRILVYGSDDSISVGAVAEVFGDAELFSLAPNEGNFDAKQYYRSQNITFRVFAVSMKEVKAAPLPWGEYLYQFRKRMMEVFTEQLNERDVGILCTMILGSKTYLEEETKQLYQSSGISHILAISGLHISILGLGLYQFLRRCRCSYPVSALISSFTVLNFAWMSGFGIAARRATVMYLFLVGAQMVGRAYDSANALALAALILLIANPMSLFQSGFLFSFTAMISICVTTSFLPEQKCGPGRREKMFRRCFLNVGIQMWMMPLTAWFYYEVPLFSYLLNLFVIPLCGWLLGFGLLGGILGMFVSSLAKWLFFVCHGILELYEVAMVGVNRIPGNSLLTGQPSVYFLFIYYVLLAGLACVRVRNSRESRISRKTVVSLGTVFASLFLCLHSPKVQTFRVDYLDVGQGDAICVSDHGQHVFIDGGSTSEEDVGKERILPFLKFHRIGKVDAWIVTHADEDHISGLIELLDSGYPVRYVLLAETIPVDDGWEKIKNASARAGVTVISVGEGETLQFGDSRMECLYPRRKEEETERNALSQVWRLECRNYSFLFPGDVGNEQEELLLQRGLLEHADVLKAAHHGSKYSSGEMFLHQVSPLLTVISCGRENRYGHPHREALERIAETGSRILSTMDSGQITVGIQREKLYVKEN